MRTENVELTNLCMIKKGDYYLLQNRIKKDWKGYTFPGGHIEPGESIVGSVIREIKEETGLLIEYPKLVGVKQFPIKNGRYIVFLFSATEFSGHIKDSDEGKVGWFTKKDFKSLSLVKDFIELLDVFEGDSTEFMYDQDNHVKIY